MSYSCSLLSDTPTSTMTATEQDRYEKCVDTLWLGGGAYLLCQGLDECLQAVEAVTSPLERVHVVRDVGVHLRCQLCASAHCSPDVTE